MRRLKLVLKNNSILAFFLLIDLVFFWKYFFQGLMPIPADLIIGGYYPWLNEKWGYVVGVPVKNALMSDVVSLLYPWRLQAIELMKSGQLPLWDATTFLGMTLIGNFQAGVFNPFNLLFWLPFSFNQIWGLQVVIQPLIAMLTMYLMLRNWQVSKHASFFGALSFAFSAQLLMWIQYNLHSFIIAVFPLLIYFIDKYLSSKKIIWLTAVSFLFAYSVFVGYPQLIYYFAVFGGLYIFYLSTSFKFWRQGIKNLLLYILFITLGLALSGPSLLPGLEAVRYSIKSLDVVAAANSVLFLPPQNLITALIPDFYGNPATNNYFGIGYYESFIFYTSIVSLPFALIALTTKPQKKRVIICLVFILTAFLFALKNPLSNFTQTLDFLGLKGSVSSRVLFVYGFCVSSLAAFGLDKLLISGLSGQKIYYKHFSLIAVLGILTGIALSLGFVKLSIGGFDLITADFSKILISVKNSVIPLTLAFSVSLLILTGKYLNKKVLFTALLALMLFDYFRFSSKYLPYLESNKIFPSTPSIAYLKEAEKPFRIGIERGELLPANTWSVYKIESASGYNILLPKQTADFLSYLNQTKTSDSYTRFTEITNVDAKLFDISNIKYYLVLLRKEGVPDKEGGEPYYINTEKFKRVFQEGPVVIYENLNALNRFYSPEKTVFVKSPLEAYQTINSENFSITSSVTTETLLPENISKCKISNLKYEVQKISVNTDCQSDGLLAFSQLYYPGWKARVNGDLQEIVKSNGIFSALKLPPGSSEILIYYWPDSFKFGIYLSLTALIILGLITTLNLKK